jgi:hypothetical protein
MHTTMDECQSAQAGAFSLLPFLLARRQAYAAADLHFIEAVRSAYEQCIAAHRPHTVPDRPAVADLGRRSPPRRPKPLAAGASRRA